MRQRSTIALFFAVLAAAGAAYLPGLTGSFLVDDYPNLTGLSVIPVGDFWDGVVRYATTGFSSPLGRPLALLTFGLQAHSWPNHAADFIYVNVLLHLLNGCLLFAVFLRLLAFLGPAGSRPSPGIAIAALGFWLLAAPQLGAVLYVVQRMALLSATCMLAGFWLYLAGRARQAAGRPRSGYGLMLAGLATGTGLGYLAKETAALFPLLVLVLEGTLLREARRDPLWRYFAALCLWLPSAVVLAELASYVWRYTPGDFMRPFTLGERVLSEARILFLYLYKSLAPPLYGIRLYYDDLALSRSLWNPWTTATSVAGWIGLAIAALVARRRAPVFSFAVAWFLVAHLLESSVIALELAFDHRNYLALAGVGFALAWYGARGLQAPALARVRPYAIAAAASYGAFLLVACWQSATLWGQPWELAHYWSRQQPDSKRAQQIAGKVYWHYGKPALAMASHERALQRWPGDVSFFLSMLEIGCAFPDTPIPDLARLPAIVARYDATIPAAVGMLETLVTATEDDRCSRYTPEQLWAVTEMTFDTPRLQEQAQNRLLLLGRIAELAKDRDTARRLLGEAVLTPPAPTPFMLFRAAEWSLLARDRACADYYLGRFERGEMKRSQAMSYRDDFDRLRQLRDRLEAEGSLPDRPADLPSCQNPAMGNAA